MYNGMSKSPSGGSYPDAYATKGYGKLRCKKGDVSVYPAAGALCRIRGNVCTLYSLAVLRPARLYGCADSAF